MNVGQPRNFDPTTMAAKAKAKTIIVQLFSSARTGYFYSTTRPRAGAKLTQKRNLAPSKDIAGPLSSSYWPLTLRNTKHSSNTNGRHEPYAIGLDRTAELTHSGTKMNVTIPNSIRHRNPNLNVHAQLVGRSGRSMDAGPIGTLVDELSRATRPLMHGHF
ncbi:60_t:CDS:2 [Acaulospora colombiana]|uniref:60_t:CDS:1 n=1 Tax=Acaulospora colombiana TaxID=27376 RepID=A0ACA9ME69_9GLOM|nr:60_t:CDS:2 [Acaulospora colombiana]